MEPVSPVNKNTIFTIEQVFIDNDEDQDGVINPGKARRAIRRLSELHINASDDELKDLVKKMDAKRDGKIDIESFTQVLLQRIQDEFKSEYEIQEAFKLFDNNGDGQISSEEFRSVMTKMGRPLSREELEIIMKEADVDGDGHINLEEFMKIMTS